MPRLLFCVAFAVSTFFTLFPSVAHAEPRTLARCRGTGPRDTTCTVTFDAPGGVVRAGTEWALFAGSMSATISGEEGSFTTSCIGFSAIASQLICSGDPPMSFHSGQTLTLRGRATGAGAWSVVAFTL